jgi:hypothetical protein
MRVNNLRCAVVLVSALAFSGAACASGSGGASRPAGATQNRIVEAELAALGQVDALQAVNRLRPQWLSSRSGAAPVLYVDGQRRSNLQELGTVRASEVEQMEYMSASDASTRYGTGHTGGAVLVTMRR